MSQNSPSSRGSPHSARTTPKVSPRTIDQRYLIRDFTDDENIQKRMRKNAAFLHDSTTKISLVLNPQTFTHSIKFSKPVKRNDLLILNNYRVYFNVLDIPVNTLTKPMISSHKLKDYPEVNYFDEGNDYFVSPYLIIGVVHQGTKEYDKILNDVLQVNLTRGGKSKPKSTKKK
jgi:hypothetical protein